MKPLRPISVVFLALISLGGVASYVQAAAPTPVVVEELALTGSGSHKHPNAATGNGRIYVSYGTDGEANFLEREEEGGSFSRTEVGSVGDNSSYFNTGITVSPDGTVHYAWIDDGRTIRYRNRPTGAGWSDGTIVSGGQDFANGLSIAVRGNNEVFVSWRLVEGGIAFGYSNNRGASWQIVTQVPVARFAYKGTPRLAAGPATAGVFLVWAGDDGDIYVGEWNGSNFINGKIADSGGTFFDPTITISPSGQPVAAWRDIDRGVFYASRQSDGRWGISNVFGQKEVAGPVAIEVDRQNNIHLAWVSRHAGEWNTWYSIKTPTEEFSAPLRMNASGFAANIEIAASVKSGYTLAHLVFEAYPGSGQHIRYIRVKTTTGPVVTPTPEPECRGCRVRQYLPLVFK